MFLRRSCSRANCWWQPNSADLSGRFSEWLGDVSKREPVVLNRVVGEVGNFTLSKLECSKQGSSNSCAWNNGTGLSAFPLVNGVREMIERDCRGHRYGGGRGEIHGSSPDQQ